MLVLGYPSSPDAEPGTYSESSGCESTQVAPLAWQARLARLTGKDPTLCPHCGRGHLRRVEDLEPALRSGVAERSPP